MMERAGCMPVMGGCHADLLSLTVQGPSAESTPYTVKRGAFSAI